MGKKQRNMKKSASPAKSPSLSKGDVSAASKAVADQAKEEREAAAMSSAAKSKSRSLETKQEAMAKTAAQDSKEDMAQDLKTAANIQNFVKKTKTFKKASEMETKAEKAVIRAMKSEQQDKSKLVTSKKKM